MEARGKLIRVGVPSRGRSGDDKPVGGGCRPELSWSSEKFGGKFFGSSKVF